MSTLTNNPNFDSRTRTAVAEIETQTDELIAAGDTAHLVSHLANLAGWEDSLRSAITENTDQIKALGDVPPDDSFLIALRGLDRNFQAALSAARALRRRVEGELPTVIVT